MKIPHSYARIHSEQAIFLVIALHEALFYKVTKESMSKVDSFKVPKPHYSDNEGHHRARARGKVLMSTNSTRELDAKVMVRDFLKAFKDHVKKNVSVKTAEKIYIFAPAQLKYTATRALPAALQKKVAGIIEGNYYKTEPLKLLKKATAMNIKSPVLTGSEAEHILHRSNIAREVIRGRS